nr:MAG TPA: hypothetical protein [Caudoviricetes sp.]
MVGSVLMLCDCSLVAMLSMSSIGLLLGDMRFELLLFLFEYFDLLVFLLKSEINFNHFLSETFSAFVLSDYNFPPISLRSDFYLVAKKINKF